MVDRLIEDVEEFCDLIELIPIFSMYERQLSHSATTAALRAFYYIEHRNTPIVFKDKYIIYETIKFVLKDKRCGWVTMCEDEKIALLTRLDAFKVFVFY